jgi:hypothetical protein
VALKDPHNDSFTRAAGASDLCLPFVLMHVAGKATDKTFIGFNLSRHFLECAGLHCQADTVKHEPSSFLSDAYLAVNLIAANAVLAIRNHPDSSKPFIKADRTVFKDSSDLNRELLPRMFHGTFPQSSSSEKRCIGIAAVRASNPIRPTQWNQELQASIRVG